MPEEVGFILLLLFWALLAYTAYLNFWVIRRLRKKLDKIVDATVAAQLPKAGLSVVPAAVEQGEMRRVQERLRVLERIAVEKENTLSRQIDELRHG